jgi:hypothetical protein
VTDRELLELAAKAAGYEYECVSHTGYPEDEQHQIRSASGSLIDWNPLTDDGDALRLAVKLKMTVDTDYNGGTFAGNADIGIDEPEYGYQEGMGEKDPYAATRRAIVRAAAEIGRNTP